VVGHSVGHYKQKVYMYMGSIPNVFRERNVSLYSSKIVDKKDILRTLSNIGIYCSTTKLVSLPRIIRFRKFHRQTQGTLQLV
jgi:hypothetical protein